MERNAPEQYKRLSYESKYIRRREEDGGGREMSKPEMLTDLKKIHPSL